ncbi:AAA family ATPase [Kribbella sp. VKM Ac-2568]|uniref:helix-turn-helix transcriptional regulator n=1 Tax=Kribbella sp. VKM Ac-2568 TaxID=2512219 RepID=UPI001047C223|nr:AAA family ATPase [Kribbella sp. VKM Ac-2568]
MGAVQARPSPRLVGRGVEERLLADALKATAGGRPCAVMVHGEAGAGKTRLVREVCDAFGAEIQVLWGTCVHFGEASVPFAPVTGALQSWLAQADAQERAEVLAGADELGTVLPALGDASPGEPGRLLPLIDLVVNRIADRRPTVVVIDDLQWADRTSLDVLAYLITGFRDQHLALLATCREEHRGEGHPLHGWLADMRRMPLFSEIHLDRLDLAATETQIQDMLGRALDIDLAAQIYERSAGNPYLTELLVGGLSGDEPRLQATAPAALRDALLASWHGLSAAARQATRVLAVGGRPTDLAVLAGVAAEHGVEPGLLSGCLTEAQDHGVVRPDGDGRPWFRHPLLAEVLYDGMPPGERVKVHATYVRVLEGMPGGQDGRVAADLAVHNHHAGRVDDSYRWSLTAAGHAAELCATSEEAIHLERACSLWDQISPDVRGSRVGHVDLLRRASRVCGRAGRLDSAVNLVREALGVVDRDSEPLLTSTLLLAWCEATYRGSAPMKAGVDELVEAVQLTQAYPDNPERALALAGLAFAERWDKSYDSAAAHAEEAVQAARRSGSELALAAALSTRAFVHLHDVASNPLADTEEAVRLARSCGSTDWLEEAAIWQVRCLKHLGRVNEATAVAQEAFQEVLAAGSEWAYFLASHAAEGLLWQGRWNDCRELLRTALAARCGGIAGASVRLTAAQLAARSGRIAEAKLHLDRALNLISEDFAGLRGDLTLAGAEVFLASGEPQKALRWLKRRIVVPNAARPHYSEDILVEFAHAAAETARAARDAGDADGVAQAVATLDDLIAKWPAESFTAERPDAVDVAMFKALFDAEVARCRGQTGQADLWRHAIEACHTAGVPWEEAVSRLRRAEAMLAAGSRGSAVSDLLRQAHLTAVELGAQPLQEEVESLARMARVSLREPVSMPSMPEGPTALGGLTPREREILAFLVAGRSNGEIAKALVISYTTVSVHVSNILRKTGTSSRVEAAALAERLGSQRVD